jgi:hypothetical protein
LQISPFQGGDIHPNYFCIKNPGKAKKEAKRLCTPPWTNKSTWAVNLSYTMEKIITNRKGETAAELADVITCDLSAQMGPFSKICDEAIQNLKTGIKTKPRTSIQAPIPSSKKKQAAQSGEDKKTTPLKSTVGQPISENKNQKGTLHKNHFEKWEDEYLFCDSECRRLMGYITVTKIGLSIFLLSIVMMLCLLSSI